MIPPALSGAEVRLVLTKTPPVPSVAKFQGNLLRSRTTRGQVSLDHYCNFSRQLSLFGPIKVISHINVVLVLCVGKSSCISLRWEKPSHVFNFLHLPTKLALIFPDD